MSKFSYSFESIKRQDNSFYDSLTDAVKRLRASKGFTTKDIKNSFIPQVIKEHTGLAIVLHVGDYDGACIIPPPIVATHIFNGFNPTHHTKAFADIKKTTLKGTIDTDKARVTGVFAELSAPLVLGAQLFKPGALNDREIAAVILHEVGHLFIHYQFVTTIAYGSLVVTQTVNNIFLSDDYGKKEYHIKMAEETLGLEPAEQVEDLIDTSKDNLEVILTTRFYRSLRERSTHGFYDVRNCEQLADTFAVKQGAGRELASGLHKFHKMYRLYGERNFFAHLLVEASKTLAIIFLSNYSCRQILMTMDQPTLYDEPKDRLAFIKFQMIDDLKRLPKGEKRIREQLVESIDEVDAMLADINVRRSFLQYIHETFRTSGRAIKNQRLEQKKVEEMLYNNLFHQSAKIKTLTQE